MERQSTDCHRIASTRWPGEPVTIFEDNDRSAYRGKRPAFTELSAAIQSHTITGVIGWDLDRMFRQPRELEAFIDLCDACHMSRVLTAAGDLDLTTHDGQLHARILVAVARKSSDDNSRRVKRAALDRAETGKYHGGPVPYGYIHNLGCITRDADTAPHVLAAATALIRGESLASIVRMGHGPRSTGGWRRLLTSPTIAGLTRLHAPANWEPIVPRATWLQVQEILERRKTSDRPHTAHWLTGLLVCGVCGGKLEAHSPTRYRCRAGACVTIDRDIAEAVTEGHLFQAARVRRIAPELMAPNTDLPNPKLTELALDYANGTITRDEWLAVRSRLLQTPASDPAPSAPIPEDLEPYWKSIQQSVAERNHIASRLLVSVVVLPAADCVSVADRIQPEHRAVPM